MRALATGAALAAASACHAAQATAYTFTTVDVPGASSTAAYGINNLGVITGVYIDSGGQGGFTRAADGTIATFSMPFLNFNVGGINDSGQISGTGIFGSGGAFGFVRNPDGSFVTFNVPGAVGTTAEDINNLGVVVGYYGPDAVAHSFIRNPDGTFVTDIVDPSSASTATAALGINNNGEIVGEYDHEAHAFLRHTDGTFTNFNFPGALGQTSARGINDLGDIVGFHDTAFNHGYLRRADGTFVTIDDPLRGNVGQITGINNAGVLSGLFSDKDGIYHGFIATPLSSVPELGTWAMMLIGFGGIALRLRRRNDNHVTAITL